MLVCVCRYIAASVCTVLQATCTTPLPPPTPIDVRMQDNRTLYCQYFKLLLLPSRKHFCDEDRSSLRNSTKFCARKAALFSFKWCGLPASCCSSEAVRALEGWPGRFTVWIPVVVSRLSFKILYFTRTLSYILCIDSKQAANLFLCSINRYICIIEVECVYSAVRTASLIVLSLSLWRDNIIKV
jgi:hypothetical protein